MGNKEGAAEGDIDVDDFSLGEGPLGVKRDRVMRFVSRLKDDEVVRGKFNKKLDAIKSIRQEQANMVKKAPITNPDLEYLEHIYNPVRDDGDEAQMA